MDCLVVAVAVAYMVRCCLVRSLFPGLVLDIDIHSNYYRSFGQQFTSRIVRV